MDEAIPRGGRNVMPKIDSRSTVRSAGPAERSDFRRRETISIMGHIRIGTSGWNYEHWRGLFYPEGLPQSEWFPHYARHFRTVEINNTFYHQPDDGTFDDWRKQAPDDFVYSVKANRYLTHLKHLKDAEKPLRNFLSGVRRLRACGGPVLYQLPPHWNRHLERLEGFLRILPSDFDHVFEFRNRDWLGEPTYELLDQYGASLCVHDLLRRHPRRTTGGVVYLRFHGSGRKYGGRYRKRSLRSWASWIRDVADGRDVYAYFNNDEGGHSVADAGRLGTLLGENAPNS